MIFLTYKTMLFIIYCAVYRISCITSEIDISGGRVTYPCNNRDHTHYSNWPSSHCVWQLLDISPPFHSTLDSFIK